MQVEASVDEADIGQVQVGQDVSFTVDSYPDDVFKAKVRQVRKAPTETQNVVSYLVIIDVDNPDEKLLPGMTANVEIITGARRSVVRVPTPALRFRPKAADHKETPGKDKKPLPTLYIAGGDIYKPTARKVTIGIQGDDYTEIVSGLKAGDRVLVRTKSLKPKTAKDDSDNTDDNDNTAS
jgi:HlyD family secretion protein